MSTSTDVVTHQRRRLTREYRGLPAGIEFHTAHHNATDATLAWVQEDPPPTAGMETVTPEVRSVYDLPPEARYYRFLLNADDVSEVITEPTPDASPVHATETDVVVERRRLTQSLNGIPAGTEVETRTISGSTIVPYTHDVPGGITVSPSLRRTWHLPSEVRSISNITGFLDSHTEVITEPTPEPTPGRQRRFRTTGGLYGLADGTEFWVNQNDNGELLAWVEEEHPHSDTFGAWGVTPERRAEYGLPPEVRRGRFCSQAVRQGRAVEVTPTTHPRYRATAARHGLTVGQEFVQSVHPNDATLVAVLTETPGGHIWTVNPRVREVYQIPDEFAGWYGRWVARGDVARASEPVEAEAAELPAQVERRRINVGGALDGPGWAEGTEFEVWPRPDAGAGDVTLIADTTGGRGWPIAEHELRTLGAPLEYSGRQGWFTRVERLPLFSEPVERPEPTYYRVERTAGLPDDWMGQKVWIDPEPDEPGALRHYYAVEDGLSMGGAPALTREKVEQYGLPVRMAGRRGWRTRTYVMDDLTPWVDPPEETPEETPTIPVYRVPEGLTQEGAGSTHLPREWVGQRIVLFPEGHWHVAFCENGTRPGGGRRLTDEERAQVPWPVDPHHFGWTLAQEVVDRLQDHLDVPPEDDPLAVGKQYVTTQQYGHWEEGTTLTVLRNENQLWVGAPPTSGGRDEFAQVAGGEYGPQYRGWTTWHASPGVFLAATRPVEPTPEPTREPAQVVSEEIADLRRQIAEQRAVFEEKMREIGTKGLEWGSRHGYLSSVTDFLDEEGIDVEPISREVSAEIVLRFRVTGELTEDVDPDEVNRRWVDRSLSVDEDYDGEGRSVLFQMDTDWEEVSWTHLSTTVESASRGDHNLL